MSEKLQTGQQRQRVERGILLRAGAVDAVARTVPVAIASETPVPWWGGDEILLCERDAVDLRPVLEVGSVLRNHDRDQIIGEPLDVRVDEDRVIRATCRFARTPAGDAAMQEVADGVLRGVSIGYSVDVYEEVRAGAKSVAGSGRFSGPCYVGTRWRVLEFSFTPVPADTSVGVGRSVDGGGAPRGGSVDGPTTAPAVPGTQTQPDQVALERQRCKDLRGLRLLGGNEEQIDGWIADGTSLADATRAIQTLRAKQSPAPVGAGGADGSGATVVADEIDRRRSYMQYNLDMRAGIKKVEKPAGVERSERFGYTELAMLALRNAGMRQGEIDGMSRSGLFQAAIRASRSAPGNTSGDLASVLANTQNKQLMQAYQEVEITWDLWASRGSLSDYKYGSRNFMSQFGALQQVPEGGEIPHKKVSDAKEPIHLDRYAGQVTFTEEMFINDDLSALSDMPRAMGAEARALPGRLLYTLLLGNSGAGPTMSDSTAFFHSSRGNLETGAGSALDDTYYQSAVDTAVQDFYGLTGRAAPGETARPITVRPTLLLVPQKRWRNAAKIGPAINAYTSDNALAFQTLGLKYAIEPLLQSLGNVNQWYLMTNQMKWAEVAFLDGNENPRVESAPAWDFYGIKTRVDLPCGVALLDPRGCVRCAGA